MPNLNNIALELINTSAKHNTMERTYIGMSQINHCIRKLFYIHNNTPSTTRDLDTEITFAIGRQMELWVIDNLKLAGFNIQGEQLEINYRGIKGHIDGLLVTDNQKFVIEVKTMGNYGYKKLQDSDLESSNPDYYMQLQGYIAATNADGGIIIVINKDASKSDTARIDYPDDITKLHVEWVSPDKQAIDRVIDRVVVMQGLKTMPPRPYGEPVKFPCTYCDFYKQCWGDVEYVAKKRGKKNDE